MKKAVAQREALARNPLSSEDILTNFYRPMPALRPVPPTHTHPGEARTAPARALADAPAPDEDDDEAAATGQEMTTPAPAQGTSKRPKPVHYKIVCISLYVEDIERLDRLVGELKRRGHTKANKSQLIRAALEQIDLEKVNKAP